MREYKFRGKRTKSKEWVYGHLFHGKNEQGKEEAFIVSKNYNCHGGIIDLDTCASWAVEAETIGQYIGLYDKNGKEIYEGDIVKIPDNYKEYGLLDMDTKNPAVLCFAYLMSNEGFRGSFKQRITEFDKGIFEKNAATKACERYLSIYQPLY